MVATLHRPSATKSAVAFEIANHWWVFCFRDSRLTDPATLSQVETIILRKLEELPLRGQVVLDFRKVEHCSSQLLGLMLAVRREVRQRGGTLVLTRANRHLTEMLSLTKLDGQFTIVDRLRDVVQQTARRSNLNDSSVGVDEVKWIDTVN
jgi:anti-anti-sigma factor